MGKNSLSLSTENSISLGMLLVAFLMLVVSIGLAFLTHQSNQLTRETIEVARATLKATQQAIEITERPWLGVSTFDFVLEEGEYIQGQARITNSGRSPARIESTSGQLFLEDEQTNESGSSFSTNTIIPGGATTWKMIFHTRPTSLGIQEISAGNAQLRVEGSIVYTDQFHNVHRLGLCFEYHKSEGSILCQTESGPEFEGADTTGSG